MRHASISLLLVSLLAFAPLSRAAPDAAQIASTPVGTWTSIDDETGDAKARVQITEDGDALQGKVIQVLKSDQGPHPVCKACEGERHDQPVEGMTILWGMKKDGDHWAGGHILDPKNGKTYKCKMTLVNGGRKLEVRGYIGFSLLGRTQTWQRVE